MARLQDEMIKAAADMLKPGGQLVLCTCSLQPEEGEALAGRVVGRNKQLKESPIRAEELPGLESALTPAGWVRRFQGPVHKGAIRDLKLGYDS